ncbi:hypothetical protein GCM10020331_068660 [Ectobacillus funiculus]
MEYIILLIVGFIAGTIGSLVGLGGGIVIVPLLTGLGALLHLPNVSPQLAVGTSIVTVVFTGLSSTLSYMKHKRVDYKSGLLFFSRKRTWKHGWLMGKPIFLIRIPSRCTLEYL